MSKRGALGLLALFIYKCIFYTHMIITPIGTQLVVFIEKNCVLGSKIL